MKKVLAVLVAVVMLGFFLAGAGQAKQMCWQVDTSNDSLDGYMRLNVSGGSWTRAAHGVWYGSMYLPVAGNMIKSPDGSQWYLQINTNFIDSYIGMLVVLNADTLTGNGIVKIIGDTASNFDVTFTGMSCRDLPPYTTPAP